MDPETFKTVKTLPVMREDGKPLMQINELEMINGELWANIWLPRMHRVGKSSSHGALRPQRFTARVSFRK